ncbi:MAG: AbrB/MazE/SpoVT family DNA-binding domain-containing protein [bacterium]|nr:AbrB/MazE/SpoVT family DNA-binding domain-containing protein [bacterium]
MSSTTVRIREDRSIVIPKDFMKRYRLIPKQQIKILEEKDGLRITKKRQDVYDKFVELLGEGLKGVEWKDIEEGRKDRCF